ncbi:helix-turn-helix domain-containing protein [Streptomyces sp. NPDC046915]|uniref:helix-turn-helix domain-containing protein n=1 Tax=Streptomyces sp. NPDC046915 TaxID=3155257 RepID=UPI0033C83997
MTTAASTCSSASSRRCTLLTEPSASPPPALPSKAPCRANLSDPRLTGWSVAEIALCAGFFNAAAFNRAFKARYGTPPGAFRRRQGDHRRCFSDHERSQMMSAARVTVPR